MEFNLLGPSYADSTKPLSAQDTINWIPEISEAEGRTKALFKTPPGLHNFATAGVAAARGMLEFQNALHAVYGGNLYVISAAGISTSLGEITGTGPVSMTATSSQLVIATGSTAYVWNGTTLSTIAGLNSPNTCAFLDQYIIFDGAGGQFQVSALNNASSIDALDFATGEAAPDDTVAVFVDHQELWVCGKETIEIWINTGDADFPFARTQGSLIERGVAAPYTLRKVDNTVYWLDNLGMVQAASGHIPQRVSTHAIEQEIALYFDRLDQFIAWEYTDKGHWYYVLQCPDMGKTFVFDAGSRQWHRRKSYSSECWKARYHQMIYGKNIVGDYASGNVWWMKDGVYLEGDDPLISERYTQYIHNEDQPIFNHSLWLKFDTGQGTPTGQGIAPVVDIRWSDDGGYNFSNYRQRSLGATGLYNKPVKIHGIGAFRDRMFHIRVSDPVKRDILTAYVRPTLGANA